jgi:hypothetical protein
LQNNVPASIKSSGTSRPFYRSTSALYSRFLLTATSLTTPEYQQDLLTLKRSLFSSIYAKNTTNGKMNGASLASLLRFLVLSANLKEGFPAVPSLWASWVIQLVQSAQQDADDYYKRV